jgi:hypothetical protein
MSSTIARDAEPLIGLPLSRSTSRSACPLVAIGLLAGLILGYLSMSPESDGRAIMGSVFLDLAALTFLDPDL